MEMWPGTSYRDLMQMPSSRRLRLITRKGDLELERKKAMEKLGRK
jgi:hypothetical protein